MYDLINETKLECLHNIQRNEDSTALSTVINGYNAYTIYTARIASTAHFAIAYTVQTAL